MMRCVIEISDDRDRDEYRSVTIARSDVYFSKRIAIVTATPIAIAAIASPAQTPRLRRRMIKRIASVAKPLTAAKIIGAAAKKIRERRADSKSDQR